jgi:hypothetical protein
MNQAQKDLIDDYGLTFSSDTGNCVLNDLKETYYDVPSLLFGYDEQDGTPKSNALHMAWREGRRSVIEHIITMMNYYNNPSLIHDDEVEEDIF